MILLDGEIIPQILVTVFGDPDGNLCQDFSRPEELPELQRTPKFFGEIFLFPGLVNTLHISLWETGKDITLRFLPAHKLLLVIICSAGLEGFGTGLLPALGKAVCYYRDAQSTDQVLQFRAS